MRNPGPAAIVVACAGVLLASLYAMPQSKPAAKQTTAQAQPQVDAGERAFQANCSRCHKAPEDLPRSTSGTVVRHMRVRATLSTKDEKAILKYLEP
jgi:mono/diheme cytochrome c family protein